MFARAIPVLMYHRVLPFRGQWTVTVDEFEGQLAFLSHNGYRALSGDELVSTLQGGDVPDRSVAITFDDGYRDSWHLAAPLLRKYKMRALLFVVTSKIRDVPHPLIGDWTETGDDRFLSWEEIRAMSDSGLFEIHSHTHSHRQFWLGSDVKKEVTDDIAASIEALRDHGFVHSMQLAWPWGYFRPEWLDEETAPGVVAMHTARPGTNFAGQGTKLIRRMAGERLTSNLSLKFFLLENPVAGRCVNAALGVWGYVRRRP